jgi:hypothetical protein
MHMKRAAKVAFGCWNWRVGEAQRVHSGASRASLKPIKWSSNTWGLFRNKRNDIADGDNCAVMYNKWVLGWLKPAELGGVYKAKTERQIKDDYWSRTDTEIDLTKQSTYFCWTFSNNR